MKNPVRDHVTARARKQITISLLLVNVILIGVMSWMSRVLLPHNIIDFELAGSVEVARTMIALWHDHDAISALFFLLGFDYMFLVVYSLSLWFVCLKSADVIKGGARWMILLAWMQPVAGVLDAIENAALFHVASGSLDEIWPRLAQWCAIPKFAIALVAIMAWLTCEAINGYRRLIS